MTLDANNGSTSSDKRDELNHYFGELLSIDEQSSQPTSAVNSKSDSEPETTSHQEALSLEIPTNSHPVLQSGIEQKTLTPEPVSGELETGADVSIGTPMRTSIQPSEALLPLAEQTPTSNKRESASYQAHKQRLEKMLQQLSPVNTESLLSTTAVSESLQAQVEDAKPVTLDVTEAEPLSVQTSVLSSEWLDNGRPHWAQDEFDILLIDVNGLKLALPLVALGHIEAIVEDLTPLFGQSKWFLGLQKTPYGHIKTIDTAEYVMSEKDAKKSPKDYNFVVSISGLKWGLAVDSIDQPISINPEDIRWRAKRSSRPWMAGTIKDQLCVLLDIPVMGELLQKEDQNHRDLAGE